jgi:hypothetical protein
VGDVTNVFFSVMMGSMALSQAGPNIKALTDAIGAMRNIVKIIKREPRIGASRELSANSNPYLPELSLV